jgi:hypothetical protein
VVSGKGNCYVGHSLFNGTENWQYSNTDTSTIKFIVHHEVNQQGDSSQITYCDKFHATYPEFNNTEYLSWGHYQRVNSFVIRIYKSRLSGYSDDWTSAQRVTAFKTWLSANPVTVIYQLKMPQTLTGAKQTISTYVTTNINNDANAIMNLTYTNLYYKSDAYVLFSENFNIASDFTFQTIASDFYPYQNAYEFSNGNNTITIKYMLAVFDSSIGQQGYFLLEVPNAITSYRIATQPFTPLISGQQVYLLIRKIGYLYDIVMKLV